RVISRDRRRPLEASSSSYLTSWFSCFGATPSTVPMRSKSSSEKANGMYERITPARTNYKDRCNEVVYPMPYLHRVYSTGQNRRCVRQKQWRIRVLEVRPSPERTPQKVSRRRTPAGDRRASRQTERSRAAPLPSSDRFRRSA